MRTSGERIRFPVAAGLFYPANKEKILEAFVSYGMEKQIDNNSQVMAVIAPHCAWDLSGQVAADAFCACKERRLSISRVVILSSIHEPVDPGLFLSNSDFFETPLGKIKVDSQANEELCSCSTIFEINDIPHLSELSIEVLLPFVKYHFPKAAIVPVLMGSIFPGLVKGFAGALQLAFGGECNNTIFIISTCLAKHTDNNKAACQADHFIKYCLEGNGNSIEQDYLNGIISGCCAPLTAAFLESGLAEKKQGCILPHGIQHFSRDGAHIYCGAIAFS